jgi:hypothetical protein
VPRSRAPVVATARTWIRSPGVKALEHNEYGILPMASELPRPPSLPAQRHPISKLA